MNADQVLLCILGVLCASLGAGLFWTARKRRQERFTMKLMKEYINASQQLNSDSLKAPSRAEKKGGVNDAKKEFNDDKEEDEFDEFEEKEYLDAFPIPIGRKGRSKKVRVGEIMQESGGRLLECVPHHLFENSIMWQPTDKYGPPEFVHLPPKGDRHGTKMYMGTKPTIVEEGDCWAHSAGGIEVFRNGSWQKIEG